VTGEKNLSLIDNSELRKFGLVVGSVLMLIGVFPVVKGGDLNAYLMIIAAILVVLAILAPAILSPVYKIWVKIGNVLGRINSFLLLSIIFFFILTPIGLISRIFKGNSMRFYKKKNMSSYWIKRGPGGTGEEMKRMF